MSMSSAAASSTSPSSSSIPSPSLIIRDVLHHLAQTLVLHLVCLCLGLLLLILGKFETFLGHTDQVLAVKLLQLLHHILVDGLGHVDHLQTSLLQPLHKGGCGNNFPALTSDVVDVLLGLLHPGHVVREGAEVVSAGGGVEPQVAGQLLSVGGVLVDSQLQVLSELLVELLEVVLVLADLLNLVHHLLDDVLANDL